MDFIKAFDKVPHGRLTKKVKAHGIQGNLPNWIQNCVCDWMPVFRDVPQGLVLGCFLLVVYVNDLDVNIGGMISKFADDTKIGDVLKTEEQSLRLQDDIDRAARWHCCLTAPGTRV